MAKKLFFAPIVLSGGIDIGGDDNDGDNGSADAPLDYKPCSYEDWLKNYAKNMDDDPEITRNDYGLWWLARGYSNDAWKEFNGDEPFPVQP